jgi:hypothetical protein
MKRRMQLNSNDAIINRLALYDAITNRLALYCVVTFSLTGRGRFGDG